MGETKETKVAIEKPKYNFNKITAIDMKEYIEKYHNDEESKKAFKTAAYVRQTEKTAVTVYEADGKPKVYVDKNGKTRVKKKMIDVNTGKQTTKFNLLKAKRYFYDTYKDEIDFENAPKSKKAESETKRGGDIFGDW